MDSAQKIYRNCCRILLAADLLMEERGFDKYGWYDVYDFDPSRDTKVRRYVSTLEDADSLLTGNLFRQYHAHGQGDLQMSPIDIVTVCTAPFRRIKGQNLIPICCVTRFTAVGSPDEVYLLGTLPVWDPSNNADGSVQEFDSNSQLWKTYSATYARLVAPNSKIKATSIPLEEVTTDDVLSLRLFSPFFEALKP